MKIMLVVFFFVLKLAFRKLLMVAPTDLIFSLSVVAVP